MALSKINYKPNETIITAKNLNNIQSEVSNLESKKLNKSGGTVTGNIKMAAKNSGYCLKDSTNLIYPAVFNNGSNLWIGNSNSEATNHTGKTIISAGYDTENSVGYKSICVSIPKVDNDGSSTAYYVWHDGYVNYEKLYPVGSCFVTTSASTNPSTFFPGTSWTLIDQLYTARYVGGSTDEEITKIFTKTSNVKTVNSAYVINNDHSVTVFLSITPNVAIGDDTLKLGTFNLDYLGVSSLGYTYVDTAYSDGLNGIPLWQVTSDGVVNHIDLVNKGTSKAAVTNTGTTYIMTQTFVLNTGHMIDSYCNQNIWKRTA